jgi:hypothetical protein
VVRVGARKLQLSLEGHAIGKSAFQTLLYAVSGRVDVIVQKLQYEVVAGVCDREILCKHLIESLVLTAFRRSIELQEIAERFELHLQKIRIG